MEIIDDLGEDRELVFRFFVFFSRFEYALKRVGFVRRRDRARAEVDWDAFANSLRERFADVENPDFQEAINFLQNDPPRTQVVGQEGLDWIDTCQGNGEYHERYILRLVNTIRNNLFHGGKYLVGDVRDVARNQQLLSAGLTVLKQCLNLCPRTKAYFEGDRLRTL